MNRSTRLALGAALWLVSILEALAMGLAGLSKFTGGRWQGLFALWGYPVWFSYVVGATEVVGALCLLVPSLAVRAALMLSVIMISATITLLTHPGPLGWITPVIHLLILIGIAAARHKSQPRLGGPLEPRPLPSPSPLRSLPHSARCGNRVRTGVGIGLGKEQAAQAGLGWAAARLPARVVAQTPRPRGLNGAKPCESRFFSTISSADPRVSTPTRRPSSTGT